MVKPHKVNPGLQRRTNIETLKHAGPFIGVPHHPEGRTALLGTQAELTSGLR